MKFTHSTFIAFLMIFSIQVYGQNYGDDEAPKSKKYNIGIRIGGTFNTFTNSNVTLVNAEKAVNIGLHGGIVFRGNIKEKMAVQAELLINERGSSQKASSVNLDQRISTKIYYIDIPLMFKYYFGNSHVRFYLGSGPQIGYGFKQRVQSKVKFNSQTDRSSTGIDWPNQFNRLAILWLIDAGVSVKFENGKTLEVGLRPQFGLNNINETPINGNNSKPIGAMLTAAYLFGK